MFFPYSCYNAQQQLTLRSLHLIKATDRGNIVSATDCDTGPDRASG